MDEENLKSLSARHETLTPETILATAITTVPRLTFACSFGAEDMVLLDMLMTKRAKVNVFYVDTNVLFEETYDLIQQVADHYTIPDLTRIEPALSLSAQARNYGDALWAADPNQCCSIRKVEPLSRHLKQYDGWITGIRRDQSPTRAHAQTFEWDKKFNLIKINPFILWTAEDVWQYIRDHEVPYNPLHNMGYPSIGCVHCTRPLRAGEGVRGE
ncbi:phosphoadenylyl-sulfate reductase [Alicyclobacillus dauci]|uniref:Adenosine 5'-phosphosulfate reductase n=1 Tax=Alicyclobacillus dauci TaxID=1475485 RepID=A0ABY6Z203_9BACL|nr:phosphoadenylyl-sulfate reductase [Alicyclobacillus dauci]WAH36628.1 phosphoadenylyl-sulfate reductase [Alicyclobacillus dauci]